MKRDLFRERGRRSLPFWVVFLLCVVLFFVVIKFTVIDKVANPIVSFAKPALEGRGLVLDTVISFFGTVSLKSSLFIENQKLKQRIAEERGKDIIISALLEDIKELRGGFNTISHDEGVRAFVLAKPPTSLYDSIILDAGTKQGITKGSIVMSPGGIALGIIETVYSSLSRAVLFSSSGEVHAVVLKGNQTVDAYGAGGGVIHATVPKDLEVEIGSPVRLSGENVLVVGTVETIGTQSAGSLKTLIIRPAANMNELGFVEIVPARSLPDESKASK